MFAHAPDLIYLVSAVCFIVGIKLLSSPETAAKGNYLSAFAMVLAVGVTLITGGITDFAWIAAGMGVVRWWVFSPRSWCT